MTDPTPTPPEDNKLVSARQTALRHWQQSLMEEPQTEEPQTATLDTLKETSAEEAEDLEHLACNLCYRPYHPEELTVASNERFNWANAVVVCPECLTELKLEMRAKSSKPDLVLGLVWAVIGFFLTAGPFCLAIWTIKSDPNYLFWQWIGCYFAFLPGFIIGRLVRFGVGRRHSLEQQLIAIFFTLAAVFTTAYVGLLADNNNFQDIIQKTTEHRAPIIDFWAFLTIRLWPAISTFPADLFWMHVGVDVGILLGIAAAFFSSEGARIYTRPFVR
jgi:hypothetical protein